MNTRIKNNSTQRVALRKAELMPVAQTTYRLREQNLPVAEKIQSPKITTDNFHRYQSLTALSFFVDELGKICRRSDVEDLHGPKERQTNYRDRFIDKDQV